MRIDRSKFLLLTSAMFACVTKHDPREVGGPIVIPAQPPPTASMTATAPAKVVEPPDAGAPSLTSYRRMILNIRPASNQPHGGRQSNQ